MCAACKLSGSNGQTLLLTTAVLAPRCAPQLLVNACCPCTLPLRPAACLTCPFGLQLSAPSAGHSGLFALPPAGAAVLPGSTGVQPGKQAAG